MNEVLGDTAILTMHCRDQKGIVAAVTSFLVQNDGNIIELDQHVDVEENLFFMRVEWEIEGFAIKPEKIEDYFQTLIGQRFKDLEWQLNISSKKPRIAIFVSHFGHCLYDLLARYEMKEWNMDIPLVISNHEEFRPIVERMGIDYYHFPINGENKKEVEQKEIALLKKHGIDLIILARYMQILSGDFVNQFPNQIINIHHSSLPAFAGANPYKNAYKRGVKFMGATAHYVTAELDEGPIIAQDVIPISHTHSIEDLKRRGRDIEKVVLSSAVWSHINHRVITYNNKTVVFE